MDKRDETTINPCTATEYILDNMQLWEVVAVSIVWNAVSILWNEETRSLMKFFLSLEQTTNKLGNISYKQWL